MPSIFRMSCTVSQKGNKKEIHFPSSLKTETPIVWHARAFESPASLAKELENCAVVNIISIQYITNNNISYQPLPVAAIKFLFDRNIFIIAQKENVALCYFISFLILKKPKREFPIIKIKGIQLFVFWSSFFVVSIRFTSKKRRTSPKMRRKQKGEKRNGPSRLNFLGLHSFILWKEPHVMNSGLNSQAWPVCDDLQLPLYRRQRINNHYQRRIYKYKKRILENQERKRRKNKNDLNRRFMHCGLRGGKKKKKDHLSCIYSPLFEKKKKKASQNARDAPPVHRRDRPPPVVCMVSLYSTELLSISLVMNFSLFYTQHTIQRYTHTQTLRI